MRALEGTSCRKRPSRQNVILQCRTDTKSLSMIHNKRTVEPPKRDRAAAVTRPYNGHRELLDDENLLSTDQMLATILK